MRWRFVLRLEKASSYVQSTTCGPILGGGLGLECVPTCWRGPLREKEAMRFEGVSWDVEAPEGD